MSMHFNLNYLNYIEDEIALEGLDGITLEGLWTRLNFLPNFSSNFTLDENGKSLLWTLIAQNAEIYFYQLPSPRPSLKIFNRYEHVDADFGIILEAEQEIEDIYEYHPIEDEMAGVRGSCKAYYVRKDITQEVSVLSLNEAMSKYGNSLVLVANQRLRDKCLCINSNVDKLYNLSLMQYAILERIGRSRTMGEITQGKNSLASLKISPKTMFYFRKRLLKLNLITKQAHRQKSTSGIFCISSLLHLTRFYVERKSKFIMLIQKAVELLNQSPNQCCPSQDMKNILGVRAHSFKKLFKSSEFQRYIKVVYTPYSEIQEEWNERDSKHKKKSSNAEKTVRCFTLANSSLKPEDVCQIDESFEFSGIDDDEEAIDDDDDNFSGILDQSNVALGVGLLRQAYYLIENAGQDGLSQIDMMKKFGQTKLDARTICRNLQRLHVIHAVMKDAGRQRVTRYVSNKYNHLTQEFHEECMKMIAMMENSEPAKEDDAKSFCEVASASQDDPLNTEVGITMQHETESSSSALLKNVFQNSGLKSPGKQSAAADSDTKKTNHFSWLDDFRQEYMNSRKNSPHVTTRVMKRANLVIQSVKSQKVIDDAAKLQKLIHESESEEGCSTKMDKKSLNRLLDRLAKSGCIKRFLVKLKTANVTRTVRFIVDPSVQPDSQLLKTAIEHNKNKLLTDILNEKTQEEKAAENKNIEPPCIERDQLDATSVSESMLEMKKMQSAPSGGFTGPLAKTPQSKNVGNKGTTVGPKFVRLQEFHRLLFYLIYGYTGKEIHDQESAWQAMIDSSGLSSLASEQKSDYPKLFSTKISWEMFIPPMPVHTRDPSSGWAFVVDILLRVPLCLFVRIVNVFSFRDELEPFVNHPLKRNLLVKHLPSGLQKLILQGRKFSMYSMELVNRLCYIGLVQYGEQMMNEKRVDQVFLYLNRHAILVDTTVSGPGYHQITTDKEYVKKAYTFRHMEDVSQYWYDMWTICMHTDLGGHSCVQGKKITMQILEKKPDIIDSLKRRSMEDAPKRDVGYIPGDGRGAGGLDSAMFSHLKRNWSCSKRLLPSSDDKKGSPAFNTSLADFSNSAGTLSNRGTGASNLDNQSYLSYLKNSSKPMGNTLGSKQRLAGIRNLRLSLYKPKGKEQTPSSLLKTNQIEKKNYKSTSQITKKRSRSSTTGGTVLKEFKARIKRVKKRPYYDEEDRAALRRMKKLRVDWSSAEDSFLLLCKVGCTYLYPNRRAQTIGFCIIRDLLHKRFPESRNKTSRACQRRINYILKNSTTEENVAIFLEEVKQDAAICEKYLTQTDILKNRVSDEPVKTLFEDLIKTLIQKFGPNNNRKCPNLPNTIEEFHRDFEVILASALDKPGPKIKEVNSIQDIDYYIVCALIYSSLCTKQDRESWAYQLYLAYQKYSQALLNSVLNALRESQMVSYKKCYNRSKYTRTCLPLSTSPFQLSCTFVQIFNQKYQFSIFGECWDLTKQLLESKRQSFCFDLDKVSSDSMVSCSDKSSDVQPHQSMVPYSDKILNLSVEADVESSNATSLNNFEAVNLKRRCSEELIGNATKRLRSSDISSEEFRDKQPLTEEVLNAPPTSPEVAHQDRGIAIVIDQEGGYCSAVLSLMTAKRIAFEIIIPEQIIKLDKDSKSDLCGKSHSVMKRIKVHETESGRKLFIPEELNTGEELSAYDEDIYSDDRWKEDSECRIESEKQTLRNEGHSENTFKNEPSEEKESSQHPDDSPKAQSNSVPPSAFKARPSAGTNSRLALYVMKDHISDGPGMRASDDIVINACDVSCRLKIPPFDVEAQHPSIFCSVEDALQIFLPLSKETLDAALQKRKKVLLPTPPLLKDVLDSLRKEDNEDYIEFLGEVYSFICTAKEIGASADKIKTTFMGNKFHPMKAVEDLENSSIVWRVGAATLRWIAIQYAKPWLIHTNKIPRAVAKSIQGARISGVYKVNESSDCNTNLAASSDIASTSGEVKADMKGPLWETEKKSHGKSDEEYHLRPRYALTSKRHRGVTEKTLCTEAAALQIHESNEYEEIDVAVRPWVRLNGCLNRRVMDRFLGSVLSFIMENPGLTALDIASKFWPALQPAHTYELIDTLITLKCVERFAVKKSSPVSLFSKPQHTTIEKVDDFDFDESYRHEATIDSVLKLSLFIGDKKYKQDFLATCR